MDNRLRDRRGHPRVSAQRAQEGRDGHHRRAPSADYHGLRQGDGPGRRPPRRV